MVNLIWKLAIIIQFNGEKLHAIFTVESEKKSTFSNQ